MKLHREEPETGTTLHAVRKPARIVDGRLIGSEIARDSSVWKVWTPRVKLARKLSKAHGWHLRLWEGECELWVPVGQEAALFAFGAKRKRIISPEARKAASERMHRTLATLKNHVKKGTCGDSFTGQGQEGI